MSAGFVDNDLNDKTGVTNIEQNSTGSNGLGHINVSHIFVPKVLLYNIDDHIA